MQRECGEYHLFLQGQPEKNQPFHICLVIFQGFLIDSSFLGRRGIRTLTFSNISVYVSSKNSSIILAVVMMGMWKGALYSKSAYLFSVTTTIFFPKSDGIITPLLLENLVTTPHYDCPSC